MKIWRWKKKWLVLLLSPFLLFLSFLLADKLYPLPVTSQRTTQTILAENGTPMWRFADENGIWRYPVTLDEVPDYYLEALLGYEDRWFYHHFGINPFAIVRAAWQYVTMGRIVSGGSTLSMQVARLLEPHDKTLLGKLHQVFRTLQLEWHYSKDEILTLYINRAPYGGTLEGIGAASWSYLGKPPSQITRSEAVLLAVLPQAPSRLRPDRYPERAQAARDKVLDRLAEFEIWPPEIIEQVAQQEVWVFPRKTPQLAPLLARRLRQQYPRQPIIRTTIDASLQYTLEDAAMNWKNRLPAKSSLAILVVDHTDMTVKSYVGSIDFNDNGRFGQVDMIRAWRSPGSTLKPFLYGFALDEGIIHSESLLQDIPRVASDYRPSNFDTGFSGPVGATESLLRSLNLPAVQLMEIYGAKRFTSKLYQVGLRLQSAGGEPNLSYILGGAASQMDQLVAAYSAFARDGKAAQLRFMPTDPLIERQLMGEGAAWVVRRILSGDGRPPLNRSVSDIVPLGWKTGTSYGFRDAWAVGVNPRYLIGVWVGRPDGTPIVGQQGRITAVPILEQINGILMNRELNQYRPLPTDPKPDSVSSVMTCWPSGEVLDKEDPNCHRSQRGWAINQMIPPTLDMVSTLNNPTYRAGWLKIWVNEQGLRVAADCSGAIEKQIALWPVGLEKWIQPNERRSTLIPQMDKDCPVPGESNYSQLLVTGIINNQFVRALPGHNELTLSLNSQGGFGSRWWFLDGELIDTLREGAKLELTLTKRGVHNLLLLDESGQIDRIKFTFE